MTEQEFVFRRMDYLGKTFLIPIYKKAFVRLSIKDKKKVIKCADYFLLQDIRRVE